MCRTNSSFFDFDRMYTKPNTTLKSNQINKTFNWNPIKEKTIRDDKEVLIQNFFWEDDEKIVGISIRFDRQIKEIPGIGTMADPHIVIELTWK